MGSRLRRLKQDLRWKKLCDGKFIGGKGCLTDVLIDRLTTYYGIAIRKHSDDYRLMQKATWAIWYHKRSTDDNILHDFGPDENDSWYSYKKSLINGTSENFKHSNSVYVAVMDAMKPVFNDISHPSLLKRCVGGKT